MREASPSCGRSHAKEQAVIVQNPMDLPIQFKKPAIMMDKRDKVKIDVIGRRRSSRCSGQGSFLQNSSAHV